MGKFDFYKACWSRTSSYYKLSKTVRRCAEGLQHGREEMQSLADHVEQVSTTLWQLSKVLDTHSSRCSLDMLDVTQRHGLQLSEMHNAIRRLGKSEAISSAPQHPPERYVASYQPMSNLPYSTIARISAPRRDSPSPIPRSHRYPYIIGARTEVQAPRPAQPFAMSRPYAFLRNLPGLFLHRCLRSQYPRIWSQRGHRPRP